MSPFTLVTVFTQDAFAGNPAAVLFLEKPLSPELCQKVAANFNQPITTFVCPSTTPSSDDTVANFDISWNTATSLISLCGHGTLAAAKALLAHPELVDGTRVRSMNFRASSGVVLTTKRLLQDDGEWFEITLPAAKMTQLGTKETARIAEIVRRAVGRDDITIKFVGAGVTPSEKKVVIELDEKDDLAGLIVNPKIFVSITL